MDDATARKQRLRKKRRAEGMKAYEVWLDTEGQTLLADLRQAGESIDAVIRRALTALQRLTPHVASPVASRDTQTQRIGHTDGATSHVPSHGPSHDIEPRPVPRPERTPSLPVESDGTLLTLLRQATPQLTYAEIASHLGLSESKVKHKAAQWAREGLLAPRPRGGARPRRGHHG
jgi:hypothetical protein